MGPLADITVLQLGDGVAAGYCGRLLAGFGATVIAIEPAEGSMLRRARVVPGAPAPEPEASPLFSYLGAQKRSLVASMEAPADAARLRGLALRADVVITAGAVPDGLDYDSLAGKNPGLVYLSLTPFGDWGPYAGWKGENITALGMGGQMWLTGEPDREPLCTAGEQAWMQLGLNGFAAASFALYGVQRTGLGQRIEISAMETVAGATEGFGPNARHLGVAQPRSGRARFSLMGIYPCQDGYAGIFGTNRQLLLFSKIAGRPEVGADPRFQSLPGMIEGDAELSPWVMGYVAGKSKAELAQIGRDTGMPMAPVATIEEVAASEHLAARRFFAEAETAGGKRVRAPGRPFNMSGTPWESGPATALGSTTFQAAEAAFPARQTANAATSAGDAPVASLLSQRPVSEPPPPNVPFDRMAGGLLEGVRVLDFTAYWAGPFATKWLADFGAEVIKVESPALMDLVRSVSSDFSHERLYDVSAYFNNYSRNKRSLTLDPANAAAREVLLEMLPHFDVVAENFKAGRMRDLRLGYEDLRAVKPDVVMVSISGYGQDGPDAVLAGVGTNMEQLSGLASLNVYSDAEQPYNTGIAYGDPTSGASAAGAVAMALRHRDRTGEGQYIEISGHETIVSLIGEQVAALSLGLSPAPKGNRHPDMAPHGCYPCEGEDQWLTIAVRTDAEWRTLCDVIERPELAAEYPDFGARKAAEDEIDAAIIGWSVLQGRDVSAERLQMSGIAAGPVLSTLDLVTDVHNRVRGYYVTVEHPDQGLAAVDGLAWRMSRSPGAVRTAAARFGEHTREVLRRFGKSQAEIDALYAAGAAADAPFRR